MADQQLIARMATASLDLKADYKHLLTEGGIEEGLNAASAVGDGCSIQPPRGYVVLNAFMHGTSEQRVRWFTRGVQTRDINQGDTFAARELEPWRPDASFPALHPDPPPLSIRFETEPDRDHGGPFVRGAVGRRRERCSRLHRGAGGLEEERLRRFQRNDLAQPSLTVKTDLQRRVPLVLLTPRRSRITQLGGDGQPHGMPVITGPILRR